MLIKALRVKVYGTGMHTFDGVEDIFVMYCFIGEGESLPILAHLQMTDARLSLIELSPLGSESTHSMLYWVSRGEGSGRHLYGVLFKFFKPCNLLVSMDPSSASYANDMTLADEHMTE